WLLSLCGGFLNSETPLLFVLCLILFCVMVCVTGVAMSNSGLDIAIHDTYYIVGQFHDALSMVAVLVIFSGFYFWIGQISGRR
ncbi:cbb3-type cytochrome c oxidase subunit I, partial [Paenibacillus amylolyticus]|uniref:cbb3-type cytochrome c oxidase subunit I n=1 Tax=Paenibacillus amylolyticus TaxID=1451 RepID=UPI0033948B85